MQVISTALPTVEPSTVIKAARIPRVAPVVITNVTIGPGTMTRMNDEQESGEEMVVHGTLELSSRGTGGAGEPGI